MLQLERGNESIHRCGCCGKQSHTVRGFLSDEHGPYGVYFAGYTEGHTPQVGTLIVSLGDWHEGAPPSAREAFVTKEIDRGSIRAEEAKRRKDSTPTTTTPTTTTPTTTTPTTTTPTTTTPTTTAQGEKGRTPTTTIQGDDNYTPTTTIQGDDNYAEDVHPV
jgi:hypothetical protein